MALVSVSPSQPFIIFVRIVCWSHIRIFFVLVSWVNIESIALIIQIKMQTDHLGIMIPPQHKDPFLGYIFFFRLAFGWAAGWAVRIQFVFAKYRSSGSNTLSIESSRQLFPTRQLLSVWYHTNRTILLYCTLSVSRMYVYFFLSCTFTLLCCVCWC